MCTVMKFIISLLNICLDFVLCSGARLKNEIAGQIKKGLRKIHESKVKKGDSDQHSNVTMTCFLSSVLFCWDFVITQHKLPG